MIQKLVSSGQINGVHFCTLNLEKSVQIILENLQWTRPNFQVQNRLISVCRNYSSLFVFLTITRRQDGAQTLRILEMNLLLLLPSPLILRHLAYQT
jgi:hypothetical protein